MSGIIKYLDHEIKKHTFDYLLLMTAGIFFLISIIIFKGERLIEFILLLAFAGFYIIWGIRHHIMDDSLNLKTVIEYILIAFTMIFLLRIIIFP